MLGLSDVGKTVRWKSCNIYLIDLSREGEVHL
jgi:hypothetical protein